MVYTAPESNTTELNSNNSTSERPNLCRQTSYKRRNSDSVDQDDFEEMCSKRGCATKNKLIACPIATFGCISELPYDDLLEHYSTKIHQETLIKVVEEYVRQLHNQPYNVNTEQNIVESEYSELLDTVDILAEGVSCLNNDNVQIQTNFVQLQSHIIEQEKQIKQLQQSVEETSHMFDAIQMNNNILQTDMETIKQTLADSSNSMSYDGSYIWKITNVAEKLADAVSERQTSIYSPAFYTSPTGYKICMRLYFNGDGHARRTHLSLFFVLMRGDYDAILQWPFQYKITFYLYDQSGNQRHIFDSFRPDTKSNSFQRPRSNMNIASGIPKFVPLATIQQENNPYVRDNSMFLRCIVDFDSLPKKYIPYVANLNPGLPVSVQQHMVQAEIEKHRTAELTASISMESSTKIDDLKGT